MCAKVTRCNVHVQKRTQSEVIVILRICFATKHTLRSAYFLSQQVQSNVIRHKTPLHNRVCKSSHSQNSLILDNCLHNLDLKRTSLRQFLRKNPSLSFWPSSETLAISLAHARFRTTPAYSIWWHLGGMQLSPATISQGSDQERKAWLLRGINGSSRKRHLHTKLDVFNIQENVNVCFRSVPQPDHLTLLHNFFHTTQLRVKNWGQIFRLAHK